MQGLLAFLIGAVIALAMLPAQPRYPTSAPPVTRIVISPCHLDEPGCVVSPNGVDDRGDRVVCIGIRGREFLARREDGMRVCHGEDEPR